MPKNIEILRISKTKVQINVEVKNPNQIKQRIKEQLKTKKTQNSFHPPLLFLLCTLFLPCLSKPFRHLLSHLKIRGDVCLSTLRRALSP